MIPEFYGQIKNGRFRLNRRDVFDAYASGLKDGVYYFKLYKLKGEPKTLPQLAYYYAVVIPTVFKQMKEDGNNTFTVNIAGRVKEIPLTMDVVNDILKLSCAKFDGENVVNKADMTKNEAREFIRSCIRWAARYLHCVIPEPKE